MKEKKYLVGSICYKTDAGRVRMTNEDRATAVVNTQGNVLMIVCDGMGGEKKGEYAASLAINEIVEKFNNKNKFYSKIGAARWIYSVIKSANKIINKESSLEGTYKGMGTTITLSLIVRDTVFVAEVGDSRAYMLRNSALKQMTEDQTYVGYLYRTGKITLEEMKTHPKRHVLMNALGIYPYANVDLRTFQYKDETIMLCSDGLYNNVSDYDITSILNSDDTTEQKVNELITFANANGGSDNIAVVLWEANK